MGLLSAKEFAQKLEINSGTAEKPLACLNADSPRRCLAFKQRTNGPVTYPHPPSAFKTRGCSLKPPGSAAFKHSCSLCVSVAYYSEQSGKNASSNNSTCHSGVGRTQIPSRSFPFFATVAQEITPFLSGKCHNFCASSWRKVHRRNASTIENRSALHTHSQILCFRESGRKRVVPTDPSDGGGGSSQSSHCVRPRSEY